MIWYLFTSIWAYMLGSVPTSVWVGKAWYGLDVREHGSKNAGATNTFRVLGKKPGIIVLTVDILKGVIAVTAPLLMINYFADEMVSSDRIQITAAVFAVLGHIFPVFAGFRGGKGVATSLGIIIGIQPLSALICLCIFLVVFVSSRYVSLGAITASIIFPVTIFMHHPEALEMQVFSIVLSLAVIFAHKKNIGRLIKGEENKMNLFGK
jgi:acyl phosphate:glycerol-3-phosphate acyltransferase